MKKKELEKRIKEALDIATNGTVDGEHHKMWVIDQMVKALTGCPKVKKEFSSSVDDSTFLWEVYGESLEYTDWVTRLEGELLVRWDEGVAP